MLLAELLGQVRVVEADVERGHEAHHGGAERHGQAPGRGAPAVAVHKRAGAPRFEPPLEAPQVAHRDSERRRDLRVLEPPATQPFQQPWPMQFLSAQRESLH